MIQETKVDTWLAKSQLPQTLSAKEVLASFPNDFTDAERVEVLTLFVDLWDYRSQELESLLEYRLAWKHNIYAFDKDYRDKFLKEIEENKWEWDRAALKDAIYEEEITKYKSVSVKYTRKEIKENLNSFSELINKLSK
jgi:hypothetical protein